MQPLLRTPFALALTLCALSLSASARATPRQLPFTYPNETLSKGQSEVELFTDVNPLRVAADASDATKGNVWAPAYAMTAEFEYGLTDRFELGIYSVFEASPQAGGDNALQFDGMKWRLRTRLAEPGEWPVDVGLYFELETMHDELSLEGKVNLQRRLGPLRLMANLWVEEQVKRPLDNYAQGRRAAFVVNPTGGVVVDANPVVQPGVEYWARGQLAPSGETEQDRENTRVHHFLGPTLHFNFGRFWWSSGLYVNLNSTATPQPGDAYGPIWFRSVIGIELN